MISENPRNAALAELEFTSEEFAAQAALPAFTPPAEPTPKDVDAYDR